MMLDLSKTDLPIEHCSKHLPGIVRWEEYQLNDILYTELYDDLSGELLYGHISMYGNVRVCTIGPDGSISMSMPTEWITNHKSMMLLIDDLKQLDVFLCVICDQYNK